MLEKIMDAYGARAQENYIPIGGNLVELKDSFYSDINSYRKGERGMTLIELLVGVAIIGTLSAIAIPQLLGAREKAKTSACQALYAPAITELTNRLENDLDEGADARDTVQGFLDNHRYEKNPRNKEQKAYILFNPLDIDTVDSCQVAINPFRRHGIWDEIFGGQKVTEKAGDKRTFRIDIN